MELIQMVISQCEVCQMVKYDRNPIQLKFGKSETTAEINQIINIDIFTIMKYNFLTTIDKFSKFG